MLRRFKKLLNIDYLYKAVFKSSSAKVLTFCLGYAFQVFLARALALDAYGTYAYIFNLVILTNTLALFGFNSASKRFIGGYRKKKLPEYTIGFILVAIITIVCLCLLVGSADYLFLYHQNKVIESISFALIVSLVIFSSFNDFFSNLLFALKKPFQAALSANGTRYFFSIVFIGIGIYLLGYNLDTYNVLVITALALMAAIVIQVFYIGKSLKFVKPRFEISTWFKASGGLLFVAAFVAIQNKIDIQLIGVLRSESEVGLYNVVYRNTQMTQFFYKAVAGVSMPVLAEMFAADSSITDIQKRLDKMKKLTFWPSAVLILVLGLGSELLLRLFGEEFVQAQPVMIVLLLGQLSIAIMGSSTMVLNMSGNHRYTMIIYFLASLFNIGLNLLLIPSYGIMGAAIATTFVNIFSSFAANAIARKKLGLNTSIINL